MRSLTVEYDGQENRIDGNFIRRGNGKSVLGFFQDGLGLGAHLKGLGFGHDFAQRIFLDHLYKGVFGRFLRCFGKDFFTNDTVELMYKFGTDDAVFDKLGGNNNRVSHQSGSVDVHIDPSTVFDFEAVDKREDVLYEAIYTVGHGRGIDGRFLRVMLRRRLCGRYQRKHYKSKDGEPFEIFQKQCMCSCYAHGDSLNRRIVDKYSEKTSSRKNYIY